MTLEELQDQLDRFRSYYNTDRPHRALGHRTKQEAFEARPKATPGSLGPPGSRFPASSGSREIARTRSVG